MAQATTPLVSREVALVEAKSKKMMNDDETVENEKVVGSSSASKTISAALALAVVVGVSATFLV